MGEKSFGCATVSTRALILVEGQTEERFIKDVLAPSFWIRELFLIPTLLVTKRVKDGPNFKGGVTNFAKFENDINLLLGGAGGTLITTMIDYYGLPNDFPGMESRPNSTCVDRVRHVEAAVSNYFSRPNFVPFFVLHEFEALLYSSDIELPRAMTEMQKQPEFAQIAREFPTPEDIDERPENSPSARVKQLFPTYKKVLHGPIVAKRIGFEQIRAACPHFDGWLARLEAYAEN